LSGASVSSVSILAMGAITSPGAQMQWQRIARPRAWRLVIPSKDGCDRRDPLPPARRRPDGRLIFDAVRIFAQPGATVPTRGFHLAYSPGSAVPSLRPTCAVRSLRRKWRTARGPNPAQPAPAITASACTPSSARRESTSAGKAWNPSSVPCPSGSGPRAPTAGDPGPRGVDDIASTDWQEAVAAALAIGAVAAAGDDHSRRPAAAPEPALAELSGGAQHC
jgi:hypothetical protein